MVFPCARKGCSGTAGRACLYALWCRSLLLLDYMFFERDSDGWSFDPIEQKVTINLFNCCERSRPFAVAICARTTKAVVANWSSDLATRYFFTAKSFGTEAFVPSCQTAMAASTRARARAAAAAVRAASKFKQLEEYLIAAGCNKPRAFAALTGCLDRFRIMYWC
jgi:hypothetical protein